MSRFFKRIFDITLALPVVLLIMPLVASAVYLAHSVQSPGPLFCVQTRVGQGGRRFRMLKFRTMHGEHRTPRSAFAIDERRLFEAGRWLRRRSIDELPQFLNVLRGEMSIVGPRPYLPEDEDTLMDWSWEHSLRRRMRPGITGLAQVRGLRGRIRSRGQLLERVQADLDYGRNWSLWLDCSLVFRTLQQIFRPPANVL